MKHFMTYFMTVHDPSSCPRLLIFHTSASVICVVVSYRCSTASFFGRNHVLQAVRLEPASRCRPSDLQQHNKPVMSHFICKLAFST